MKFHASRAARTHSCGIVLFLLFVLSSCQSRSVNDSPDAAIRAAAECDAFISTMSRCIGNITHGGESLAAIRASLVPSANASDSDLRALRDRCSKSRAQAARACK
jgi:hypothetical protein